MAIIYFTISGSGGSSTLEGRIGSFVLLTAGADDDTYKYGIDLDDQDVVAEAGTYVELSCGRFCCGALGGVIEGGVMSIKDFLASLDFPLGVLGELLLGPPNFVLGEFSDISGDADRCLLGGVVSTFVVAFVIVASTLSYHENGDGVRRR